MEERAVIQKDNKLVRKAINKFTYKQNQLMCVLLGKYVHTKDNYCIDTTITISDFRKALELSDGKDNLEGIKRAVEKFGENGSVGIYDEKREKYIWRPYFKQIELDKTSVKFIWNDAMKEDLLNLKTKYTSYLANDYLKLNSLYSQNLYEQLKSYENMPTKPQIAFNIDDLHRIMQTDIPKKKIKGEKKNVYKSFNTFKTMCINRAIEDINEKTDIFVEYKTVKDKKDRRKAAGIAFTIHSKNEEFNYNGCWLNGDQISEIIYTHFAKNKILDLGKIKKENKQYYTLLRQGNKSDYEIILNFIEQDKKKQEKANQEEQKEESEQFYGFHEEMDPTDEDVVAGQMGFEF